MTNPIVVEHHFDSEDELRQWQSSRTTMTQTDNQSAVHCTRILSSTDNRRALSFFSGIDRQSVVDFLNRHNVPFTHIWHGAPLRPQSPPKPTHLVDVILLRAMPEPITPEMAVASFVENKTCFDIRQTDWHQSYLDTDGIRLVCWFHAPDAESVRSAVEAAGSPYVAVWTVESS